MKEEEYQSALLKVRTALGLHRDSHDDLVTVATKLRAENEVLHARYEYVRRLTPLQYKDLWNTYQYGPDHEMFDYLVDRRIKDQPLGGLPK